MRNFCRYITILFVVSCMLSGGAPISCADDAAPAGLSDERVPPLPTIRAAEAGGLLIGSVRTSGNLAVTDEQILSRVRSRAGERFNRISAASDAKRIAELDGIEYSYYNTEVALGEIVLTYVVVERNIIRAVLFKGNRDWSAKSLAKKLHFKRGDFLDPVLAEVGRRSLLEFYHEKGYAFAAVELDSQRLSAGELVYKIDEGARVRISAVRFSGNKAIKKSGLKKVIKTKKKKFFILSRYLDRQKVARDVTSLGKLYQRKGYLDAEVKSETNFNEAKDRVEIVFVIDEGAVYTVEKISIKGDEHFERDRILGRLRMKTGDVYSQKRADSDVDSLVQLYRENGFVDASVEHRRGFVSVGRVNVEFELKCGQRFRIGQIIISGNEQTQDRVIRRVLDEYEFQPGRWYNADTAAGDGTGQLEKTVKGVVMAESVTISASGGAEGQRDAQVSVVEGQTGSVMVGAGIASDSGVIGQFVFEQRNFDISDTPEGFGDFITAEAFKGAGQSLRIALQPGTEVSQYSISFTEPYLNDKPLSLNVVASTYERFFESYTEGRSKGYVGFEKRYRDKWRRSFGIRIENVDVGDIDLDAPQEIKDLKGDNFITGLRLSAGRDMTNDRFNPSGGYSFDVGYEQVAGEHTFGILSGTYRRYATLYEDLAERKTVFAGKLHAATTLGDAPFFEKFYAGGNNSIRGFEYRGVSPRGLPTTTTSTKHKDPIGSDWIFLAGGEVTVPLVGESLGMLFFVDSGAIETGPYRVAAGVGIQILIPQWFGPVPMRFELATPLFKDDEDDTQVFSFSIGRLF